MARQRVGTGARPPGVRSGQSPRRDTSIPRDECAKLKYGSWPRLAGHAASSKPTRRERHSQNTALTLIPRPCLESLQFKFQLGRSLLGRDPLGAFLEPSVAFLEPSVAFLEPSVAFLEPSVA